MEYISNQMVISSALEEDEQIPDINEYIKKSYFNHDCNPKCIKCQIAEAVMRS